MPLLHLFHPLSNNIGARVAPPFPEKKLPNFVGGGRVRWRIRVAPEVLRFGPENLALLGLHGAVVLWSPQSVIKEPLLRPKGVVE